MTGTELVRALGLEAIPGAATYACPKCKTRVAASSEIEMRPHAEYDRLLCHIGNCGGPLSPGGKSVIGAACCGKIAVPARLVVCSHCRRFVCSEHTAPQLCLDCNEPLLVVPPVLEDTSEP